MQKSQKLENEYFSQTEMTAKELFFFGSEIDENEIITSRMTDLILFIWPNLHFPLQLDTGIFSDISH